MEDWKVLFEKDTKRQHYVAQMYLRAWATDGVIWCKRRDNIFSTSSLNLAHERLFYEVDVLSEVEFRFVLAFIERLPRESHALLVENLMLYCTCSDIDFLKRNGIEKYHGVFENMVAPTLETLRTGNLAVLGDEQTRIDFCKFLGRQYTRTKKIKASVPSIQPLDTPIPEEFRSCDMEKVGRVLTFLFADAIGNWAYSSGKFTLLRSPQKRLMTNDQPVSNTKAMKDIPPTEMELFYPLSPEYALLINTEETGDRDLSNEEVTSWNHYILSTAHEMIFANQRELLDDR